MKIGNAICILAKPPENNELTVHLGNKQALQLYRAFLLDSIAIALRVPRCQVYLAYHPSTARNDIEDIIYLFKNEEQNKSLVHKAVDIELICQTGENSSQVLCNLSRTIFEKGAKRLLIIYPDSPLIDSVVLRAAFELLKKNNVILGPTFDGGHYLIALDNCYQELFQGVDWTKDNTYKQTIDKLAYLKLDLQELELSYDVGRLEELEQLYCDIDNFRLTGKDDICYHTEKCLANLKK